MNTPCNQNDASTGWQQAIVYVT